MVGSIAWAVMCACGSEQAEPDPAAAATRAPAGSHRPDLSDIALSAGDVESMSRGSPTQSATAQDRVLSFAEYESIFLEATDCYQKAGYDLAFGLRLTAYGYYHAEYVPRPGIELEDFGDKEPCRKQLQPAHTIWSKAKSVPGSIPQTLLEEAHDLFWACMEESGVDLHGNVPGLDAARAIISSQNSEDLNKLAACQRRVFDEVGLPNWIA